MAAVLCWFWLFLCMAAGQLMLLGLAHLKFLIIFSFLTKTKNYVISCLVHCFVNGIFVEYHTCVSMTLTHTCFHESNTHVNILENAWPERFSTLHCNISEHTFLSRLKNTIAAKLCFYLLGVQQRWSRNFLYTLIQQIFKKWENVLWKT